MANERIPKIWQLPIQEHEQFTEKYFRRMGSRYKYIEKGDKLMRSVVTKQKRALKMNMSSST